MIVTPLFTGSQTPPQCPRRMGVLAGALVLTAGLLSPCNAADITIDSGYIENVSVSPDGRTIVAAIEGLGEMGQGYSTVRWWNWNETDSVWRFPGHHVGAFAWTADGSLLVGEWSEGRMPIARWWRLGSGGVVQAACEGYPRGKGHVASPARRDKENDELGYLGSNKLTGIASITELASGQVVTGGVDHSLAVWDGCTPTWLDAETCCLTDHPITVTARGKDFETSGEGVWQSEEGGYYKEVGLRRWSPSPWKAVPVKAPAVPAATTETKAQVEGMDCTATIDALGHIVVVGTHPWKASIGADDWQNLAASRDCKTLAAATDQRIVKITPPKSK